MSNKGKNATFQFMNFVVRESHIVFNKPGDDNISLNFEPNGTVLVELNQFHLSMKVAITSGDDNFKITLDTVSLFSFPDDADLEAYKNSYFSLNAPAIVFPYLRAYITALTALSGLPPIVLPTLNMMNIGEQLKENIVEVS